MTRDFSTHSPGPLRRGFHRLFRHFVKPYPDNAQHLGFKTGERWIDEREIYRKIVVINSMPADDTLQEVAHNIPSIGKVIYFRAVVRDGTTSWQLLPNHPYYTYVDTTNFGVRAPADAGVAGKGIEVYIDYVLPE